uniref:Transposase n=1 Tax=Salvator merianae TaxID=96440 RepID=A0A8D0BMD3_SALMN
MILKQINSPCNGSTQVLQDQSNSRPKSRPERFLATVFWDLESDYLPKGQSVDAEYYCNLLCQLKEALKGKGRGNLQTGVLFLQDNAPAHKAGKMMDVLRKLGFQCLDHPPYSPDLAPSDYFLFPNLKKSLKECQCLSDLEVIAAAEQHFRDQTSEFFLEGLGKFQAQCVELQGEYVE